MSFFRIAWLLNYISIASFSAAIITPALPEIKQHYSLLQGQVEWMVSAFLIGYVVGQLIYGPLANRFGRIKALQIGLSLNLIGILWCIAALYIHSYALLIIGRLISALGSASGLTCTFILINEWIPENQRKSVMGSTIIFFTFGIGLAVLLGGLVTQYANWSYCFLLLLVHGLIMLYGTKILDETLLVSQQLNLSSIIANYKQALLSRELLIYSLVVGLCSAIGYCFSAAGPLVAHQLFLLSPTQYGYWNGLNMLGMLIGGVMAKMLLQHYKAERLVHWGLFGTALGLISLIKMAYTINPSPLWFFASTFVLYLFSGFLFSGGAYLASNSIIDKASGSAMMSFINMTTAVVAVICLGYICHNPLLAFIGVIGGLWLLLVTILSYQLLSRFFLKITKSVY